MPRVLIVSPHFPPVNAPDMQRVRMSLPHFVDAGWEIVVLTVDDHDPLAPLEPELLPTIPRAVRVERAPVLSRSWTRYLGINNLGLRALPYLYFAGADLLRQVRFDLVYFSTTQFVILPLGRLWHREFDVPYVIDLQDPWLNDYYSQPGAPRPPGGWKYFFAHGTARLMEGWTVRQCAHIISVSGHYLTALRQRYSFFDPARGSVLTFGAPDADFAAARAAAAASAPLLPPTSRRKMAYAGRLGPDMLPTLAILFAAIARCRAAGLEIELYFHGTSYAPAGQGAASTTALAREHGIADLVQESPARIRYLDSLRLMLETDIALVLGSEDRAYSPSKLYPTLLAKRPTLALAPRKSVLEERVREIGGAALVTFGSPDDNEAITQLQELLHANAAAPDRLLGAPVNQGLLEERYTAAAVAARQLAIFNTIIQAGQSEIDPAEDSPWTALPAP